MKRVKKTALLCEAVIMNDSKAIIALIKEGHNINEYDDNSFTPLHYAVQNGSYKITELLLRSGAVVDIKDENGNTPLSEAVYSFRNDPIIIKLLLQYGADKNIKNNYGISPYDLAKTIANYPVLQYLE